MLRKTAIAALAFLAFAGSSQLNAASAAELWMVEEKGCMWCRQWQADIGEIYPKTEEGRIAPLRRVDIHQALPQDAVLKSRPQYTPTFILVDNGKEVGRIEGYPGADWFWGLLAELFKKLPDQQDSNS